MSTAKAVRVVRIIARLNIGGPAIQAITLTKLLEPLGYETTLIRGVEGPREGTMDPLADKLGVHPVRVESLRRELGAHDAAAIARVAKILRSVRPDVLHTHTAKAGTVGRLAALVAVPRPRVRVHTFHGHVLTGYFSPLKARIFRNIERFLARTCTRLIAVSAEVRDDLVELGIAPAEKIEVIPLGFDLSTFEMTAEARSERRAHFRSDHGIPVEAQVVTLVARLVPIKRVDRFLRIATRLADRKNVWFVVAGDGELAEELQSSPEAHAIPNLVWAGFQSDMPVVLAASDAVVLTSDNEGTPVSLIEAQAASVPVVTTNVGGAQTVVREGATGRIVPVEDEAGFAAAIATLLDDEELARSFGRAGAAHVRERFSLERLVADIDALYRRLLRPR